MSNLLSKVAGTAVGITTTVIGTAIVKAASERLNAKVTAATSSR